MKNGAPSPHQSYAISHMRALSIRQPWAELILSGRKTIETRTWRTSHQGLIAVHAGRIIDQEICALYGYDPQVLPHGGLIGTVEVAGWIEFAAETWRTLRDRHCVPDDEPGRRVGWLLANPRPFDHVIPLRGLPGLFPLPSEIVEQIGGDAETSGSSRKDWIQ